jgi:hypothetical protein
LVGAAILSAHKRLREREAALSCKRMNIASVLSTDSGHARDVDCRLSPIRLKTQSASVDERFPTVPADANGGKNVEH